MDLRHLNEIAQGLHDFENSIEEFDSRSDREKVDILSRLDFVIAQAYATNAEFERARIACRLPRDFEPVSEHDDSGIHTGLRSEIVIGLESQPSNSGAFRDQYRFLMTLFSIADARRRDQCGPDCHHWWHNLAKERQQTE